MKDMTIVRTDATATWAFILDIMAEALARSDAEALDHLPPGRRRTIARKRAQRHPVPFVDEETGAICLNVPLNRQRTEWATVELEDWLTVQNLGATGLWYLDDNGRGDLRVKTKPRMRRHTAAKSLTVARLILGLGRGERVKFLNGDSRDLRRSNLAVQGRRETDRAKSARYDARASAMAGADMARELAALRRQGGRA
ncbi:hypothetical protein [Rhodovulum visakhapatnamense]|nr:hypothetical protein [Rhodovulum visakhapatnamense]